MTRVSVRRAEHNPKSLTFALTWEEFEEGGIFSPIKQKKGLHSRNLYANDLATGILASTCATVQISKMEKATLLYQRQNALIKRGYLKGNSNLNQYEIFCR